MVAQGTNGLHSDIISNGSLEAVGIVDLKATWAQHCRASTALRKKYASNLERRTLTDQENITEGANDM